MTKLDFVLGVAGNWVAAVGQWILGLFKSRNTSPAPPTFSIGNVGRDVVNGTVNNNNIDIVMDCDDVGEELLDITNTYPEIMAEIKGMVLELPKFNYFFVLSGRNNSFAYNGEYLAIFENEHSRRL